MSIRAPKFPKEATWLNTDEPIRLEDLKGSVVLLDFFTYCCINCMHVLPILDRLEKELEGEPFQVIGIHSGKFDQEKDVANIARAIQRHGIRHPVLVDSDHDTWSEYAVKAWPTLVLIDSDGKVAKQIAGEPTYESLLLKVKNQLAKDSAEGKLQNVKRKIRAVEPPVSSKLLHPGKVRIFPPEDKGAPHLLVISDTGHHRILLGAVSFDVEGWPRVDRVETVGTGGVGAQNGAFGVASFRRPQGVGKLGDHLYVCDTENYLLRRIDLQNRTVDTVAGSGELFGEYLDEDPLSAPLRSPWDCLGTEGSVLIAMAGAHQLWVYDPDRVSIFTVVGTGAEDHIDGKFDKAALAQPSSLYRVGNAALFVDAETSSIRIADFESQIVGTIMGKGLFDFGDRDGPLEEARLQHPLGLVSIQQYLFIADTFNNKIKRVDVSKEISETYYGDGSAEMLSEPGGIETLGDFLYVPDTNNHRILVLRISDQSCRTLDFQVG